MSNPTHLFVLLCLQLCFTACNLYSFIYSLIITETNLFLYQMLLRKDTKMFKQQEQYHVMHTCNVLSPCLVHVYTATGFSWHGCSNHSVWAESKLISQGSSEAAILCCWHRLHGVPLSVSTREWKVTCLDLQKKIVKILKSPNAVTLFNCS